MGDKTYDYPSMDKCFDYLQPLLHKQLGLSFYCGYFVLVGLRATNSIMSISCDKRSYTVIAHYKV